MKKVYILSLVLCASFSYGEEILHVKETCKQEYIDDIYKLETQDASLYWYYDGIANGACLGVEYKEGRFKKISKHFAKLGNIDAKINITPAEELDRTFINKIIELAANGNISAKSIIVHSLIADHPSHTKPSYLKQLKINDQLAKKYVEEVRILARKGDIRAIDSALLYALYAPVVHRAYGAKTTDMYTKRINDIFYLSENYNRYHPSRALAFYLFERRAKDITWCHENVKNKVYVDGFSSSLDSVSRSFYCTDYYYSPELMSRLTEMTNTERLQYLLEIVNSIDDITTEREKRKDSIINFDSKVQKIAHLAYFDVPFSKEIIAFWISYSAPYLDEYSSVEKYYWSYKDKGAKSIFRRFIDRMNGINSYDPKASSEQLVIPEIMLSKAHYAFYLKESGRSEKFKNLVMEELLPAGWIGGLLYVFDMSIVNKDYSYAYALAEAMGNYNSNVSSQMKEHLTSSAGSNLGYEKQGERILATFEPFLPTEREAFLNLSVYWERDIKPYLIRNIKQELEKAE